MSHKLQYILTVGLFVVGFAFAKANTPPPTLNTITQDSLLQEELHYDTEPLTIRELDNTLLEDLKKNPEYDYNEQLPEDNWYTRLKRKLSELYNAFIEWLLGDTPATGVLAFLVRILPYLLILGFLIFMVWLIVRIDNGSLMMSNYKKGAIAFSADEEIIQHQDINALIKTALKDGNYRLAVRYYYLLTLQKLTAQDLIAWEAQKTNHDYIFELKDQQLRADFRSLTGMYDYIWYGNFSVDASAFAKAENAFKTLHNTL